MADVRRLLPDQADTSVEEQLATLDLPSLAHPERPYTITNFALTVDGHATISGRSGAIGTDTDTAMLVGLRNAVDAVMIGAGTMRAERYGPMPGRRPVVLVSNRLDLPWDAGLFTDGEGQVLIFTTAETEPPETATPVEVVRHEGSVDLTAAMRHLRSEHDIRALLCEGGPHLHAQLIDDDLVDEIFITTAPKLAGGTGPKLVEGLAEKVRELELSWLLDDGGELFARYRIERG